MNTEGNCRNYDLTIQNMKRVLEDLAQDPTYTKRCQDLLLLLEEPKVNADAIIEGISALKLQDNHHLQWGSWLLKAEQADWDLTGRSMYDRNAFALYVLDPGKLYSGSAFANEAAEHIKALTGHEITKDLHRLLIACFHSHSGRTWDQWVSDVEGRGKIYSGAQILNRIKGPESWFFTGKSAYERVKNGEVAFLYATMKPEYIPEEFQVQEDIPNEPIFQAEVETKAPLIDEELKTQDPMVAQDSYEEATGGSQLKPQEEGKDEALMISFPKRFSNRVKNVVTSKWTAVLMIAICFSFVGATIHKYWAPQRAQVTGLAAVAPNAEITYKKFEKAKLVKSNLKEFFGAAWVLNRNGNFKLGEEAAYRMLDSGVDSVKPAALLLLGEATKKQGRYSFALKRFEESEQLYIANGRKSYNARMEQAFCLYLLERFDEAWNILDEGIELDGNGKLARLASLRSIVLLSLGNPEQALLEAQKSLKLYSEIDHNAGSADAHSTIGLCYYVLGNIPEGNESTNFAHQLSVALNDQEKIWANKINIAYRDQNVELMTEIREYSREKNTLWLETIMDNVMQIERNSL